jgi:DNA repair exonuclease SbcCD ATPase subunit
VGLLSVGLLSVGLLSVGAVAQEASTEDRLRDALRHVTADLRAAQDSQTTLQAALDQAQKQRDLLQQQVTQLNAQIAAQPAAQPTPQPAQPDQQFRDVVETLKKQNAALQDGLAHWQTAYQQAATLAQTKDAQGRQSAATASTAQRTLDVCEAKNGKLIAVANDILHMYDTRKFRSLASGSWDSVLGFKKVELENIVQDNEDRILDQKYYPGEQPAGPPPARHGTAP